MGKPRFVPLAIVAAAFVLVAGFLIGTRSGIAQDASPTAGDVEHQHPVHIHLGTCATLGEVVFPLNDLVSPDMASPVAVDASMMATPIAGMGEVVAQSTTTVAADLQTIIDGGHAINAHESVELIQNYIACGDITGTPTGGQLTIQLNEQNDSGYMGQAMLTENADGTTTVTVMLMMATDGATPTA